jgi:hypothetical protein
MKKSSFLLLLLLPKDTFAGDLDNQIAEIRKRYATSKELHKKNKSTACKSTNWQDDGRFDQVYKNTVSYCDYGQGYSRVAFELNWWETTLNGEYYYYNDPEDSEDTSNGTLYFAYIVNASSGPKQTTRLYFNDNQEPIKAMQEETDSGTETMTKQSNREQMLKTALYAYEYLSKAQQYYIAKSR